VVVRVNELTCDVISSTSSHIATVPFDLMRQSHATYKSNAPAQMFMPVNNRWRHACVLENTTASHARIRLLETDVDDETILHCPLNLLRPTEFKIDIGKQIEVMDDQNLHWEDGYAQADALDRAGHSESGTMVHEMLGTSMILIKQSDQVPTSNRVRHERQTSEMIMNKWKWSIPQDFQTIRAVDGRQLFPLSVYFVRDATTGKYPASNMPTRQQLLSTPLKSFNSPQQHIGSATQKASATSATSSISLTNAASLVSTIIDSPASQHREISLNMHRGDHDCDNFFLPTVTDYTNTINRLKQHRTMNIPENTSRNTLRSSVAQERVEDEKATLSAEALYRTQSPLYKTTGWSSPDGPKIRNEELDVRDELVNRIQQLKNGVNQRQQKAVAASTGQDSRQHALPAGVDRRYIRRQHQRNIGNNISSTSSTSKSSTTTTNRPPEKSNAQQWSPTKDWNSSVALHKHRRPTLRHTVLDEMHSDNYPYQPKAFNPLPSSIFGQDGSQPIRHRTSIWHHNEAVQQDRETEVKSAMPKGRAAILTRKMQLSREVARRVQRMQAGNM
jgi:hypothetical protein